MVRRWSCLNILKLSVFHLTTKKWKKPLTMYKKIMKFNKYKFLKKWKARSSKRRRFGKLRTTLIYTRLFPGIWAWSWATKFRAVYKNYIWLISYKYFRLPDFKRYSYVNYNKKLPHPIITQIFYFNSPQLTLKSAPLVEHRNFFIKNHWKKQTAAQTLLFLLGATFEIILQFILFIYKTTITSTLFLLNDCL